MTVSIDPDKIPFVPGEEATPENERTGDPRIDAVVTWLADDVQGYPPTLARICDAVSQRMSGAETDDMELGGNAWDVTITPAGLSLKNCYTARQETLSLADVSLILHRYWDYCRVDWGAGKFDKLLAKFTNKNGRPPQLPWD